MIESHVVHSQQLPCDIGEEGVEDEGTGVGVDAPEIGHLREDGGVIVDAFLLISLGGHSLHRFSHHLPEGLQFLLW